jgi:hypothetical protein
MELSVQPTMDPDSNPGLINCADAHSESAIAAITRVKFFMCVLFLDE